MLGRGCAVLWLLSMGACAGPASHLVPQLTPEVELSEGVAHRVGTFTASDGTVLFEQGWGPAEGEPRATLVVVHGLKDYSGRYAAFAEGFARRGFLVRAFDLRGHGWSQGRRVVVGKFDDYVGDLDLFLTRVQAQLPGKPVFVFGHSMGGAIVVSEILEHHPKVAGVILSGAALEHGLSGFKEANVKLVGAVLPNLGVLTLPDADFSRDPAIVAGMRTDPLIYDPSGPAHTAAELVRAIDRIDAQMEAFDAPVLVLHGAADRVTPPWGSWQLYSRASSKDKSLQWYGGYYHDLLHEPGHERVVTDIQTWVEARMK